MRRHIPAKAERASLQRCEIEWSALARRDVDDEGGGRAVAPPNDRDRESAWHERRDVRIEIAHVQLARLSRSRWKQQHAMRLRGRDGERPFAIRREFLRTPASDLDGRSAVHAAHQHLVVRLELVEAREQHRSAVARDVTGQRPATPVQIAIARLTRRGTRECAAGFAGRQENVPVRINIQDEQIARHVPHRAPIALRLRVRIHCFDLPMRFGGCAAVPDLPSIG